MNAVNAPRTERQRATLHGLKVVEFGQLVAGPLAGTLLADLGADVIHVEDPERGDPVRMMGAKKDGTHLWWKVGGRNKRSVRLDLRKPEGQDVARRLAQWADVVITNMRVATLEAWGLDWPSLHAANPKLVMLQVTGYGAATSRRNEPGFGKVGEARSGVVHLTGFEDGPPIHTGFSHADTITALMGAFAVQAAVYRQVTDPDFDGEWIDLAVDEALFRLVEFQIVMYDQLGIVPHRVGQAIFGATGALINAYRAVDGRWVTVTSGTPRSVQNIARLVGEPPEDYATGDLIAANRSRLDVKLEAWIGQHDAQHALDTMQHAEVTAALVFDVSDIVNDETYRERGSIITVDDPDLGPLRMQGVGPRLANHTGDVWTPAPKLGEHDDAVYKGLLGMDDAELAHLRAAGVLAG